MDAVKQYALDERRALGFCPPSRWIHVSSTLYELIGGEPGVDDAPKNFKPWLPVMDWAALDMDQHPEECYKPRITLLSKATVRLANGAVVSGKFSAAGFGRELDYPFELGEAVPLWGDKS